MVLGPKKQRRKKKKSPQECQCYGYINNIDNRVRALEDSTNINTLNLQNLSLQQLFQYSILLNMEIQNRLNEIGMISQQTPYPPPPPPSPPPPPPPGDAFFFEF